MATTHIFSVSARHNIAKPNGFTLVELAIALMVIGLLIGGVLKGQELIENARMTSLIRQMNDYKAAVSIFRSTYGHIPGDVPNPSSRIRDCTTAPCATTHGTALGNGMLDWYQFSPAGWFSRSYPYAYHRNNLGIEWRNFWVQLVKTGLITSSGLDITTLGASTGGAVNTIDMTPRTALTGIHLTPVTYNDASIGSPIMGPSIWLLNGPRVWDSQSLTPLQMQHIDTKIDDGLPVSGSFRVGSDGVGSSGIPPINTACADTGANVYRNTEDRVCGFAYDISP